MTEADPLLSLGEIQRVAEQALLKAGANAGAAASLSAAIAAAEADGLASHGLAYLPTYCSHLRCGKVDGTAIPQVTRPKPSLLSVDAGCGFAHPAIDAGFAELVPLAFVQGIAALAIRNSYNCGVLGYHTERLARAGLVGLGFTHAPASIAPAGGRKPVVGTNPIAIAAPDGKGGCRISIDQSASVVAKSEIIRRQRSGQSIPEGWAFDPDGRPTTDPATALQGTMAPSGGYKGVGIALLVEILAAAASGAALGLNASPFSGTVGGPPRTGQFFIAIDVAATSGDRFAGAIAELASAIEGQPGGHVPGSKRQAARKLAARDGVRVNAALLQEITQLATA